MPSTTTDIQPTVDTLRAVLAPIVDPDTIDAVFQTLPEASRDDLDRLLRELAPTHLAVFEALNPDGSIRDQDAYDRLIAGAETAR